MKRTTKWYAWLGMIILALALAAVLAPATPAHAAPASTSARSHAATGGSLALSITNGSSFQFDGYTGPHFHLVVQLNAAPTTTGMTSATITLDTGQTLGAGIYLTTGDSQATGGYNVNEAITPLPIGNHSASATYQDPTNSNQLLTSNTVYFTITPINGGLMCGVGVGPLSNSIGVWKPGQSVTIGMQSENYDSNYPIDWTKVTATITLKGPKTVTYSNLSLDNNGATTITAPTTLGYYAMDCKVSEVPYYSFSDTGFSSPAYLVSQLKLLSGIKLYTSPTTLVQNRSIQMYIVFEPGPGLPMPTGTFSVQVGTGNWAYYTRPQKVAPDGTGSLTLAPIQNLYAANSITIHYFGDLNYKQQYKTFPMTNPAISGSGGTTPSKPTATPKPRATATAGATPTEDAGSGATSGPPAQAPTPSAGPSVLGAFGPFSGGGLIALLVVVALLALGGGVGTFVLLSRRGSASASPDYPIARSPLDVDTAPNLDTTRPEAPPWWRQDDGPYGGQ